MKLLCYFNIVAQISLAKKSVGEPVELHLYIMSNCSTDSTAIPIFLQVLSALREHKLEKRFVPISLENPDKQMIAKLKELMKLWMTEKCGKKVHPLTSKVSEI